MSLPPRMQDALLSGRDLMHNARHLKHYELHSPTQHSASSAPNEKTSQSAKATVLKGKILTESMSSGVSVHLVDAQAVKDFGFEAELAPSLKISLFMAGETRFQFGHNKHVLRGKAKQAQVMNLSHAESCKMGTQIGEKRTALYVSVAPEWFEKQGIESPELHKQLSKHLALDDWALPESLWLQANMLIQQKDNGEVNRMAREGFALTLLSTWLSAIEPKGDSVKRPEQRRLRQFRELMESDQVREMSLAQIGQQLGMSPATLQRYAHEHLGMSLTQYLRSQRLEMAYQALVSEGVSIMEAAFLAGYNHASNFTIAFKKQFGILPTEAYRTPLLK